MLKVTLIICSCLFLATLFLQTFALPEPEADPDPQYYGGWGRGYGGYGGYGRGYGGWGRGYGGYGGYGRGYGGWGRRW